MINNNISIIIPTYNRSKLLKRAILSAVNQSYRNVEIIVSDDGSTDNTEAIVKKLQKKDKRIIYLKNKHSGLPAKTRNYAIKKATSKWLAFLDDDDEWYDDKLESQLNIIKKYQLSAICTNANKNGKDLFFSEKRRSGNINYNELIKDNKIICSSVLIKKELLVMVNLFDESYDNIAIEDYITWLKACSYSSFYYFSSSTLNYRDFEKKTIRSTWINKSMIQREQVLNTIYKWLLNNKRFSVYYLYNLFITYLAKNNS